MVGDADGNYAKNGRSVREIRCAMAKTSHNEWIN